MGDIADDRLPTGINVDMLDDHLLPTAAPHVREGIHLACKHPL